VLCSLDATGSLFRYIRHPASWEHAVKNLNRLRDLDNVKLEIDCTVNNYSIHRLDEFIEWTKYYPDVDLYLNILYWPRWLNIQCLPNEMKHSISQKLKDYPESKKVISYMFNEDMYDRDFDEFVAYTDYLDEKRGEDILTEIPEYAKYMELHRK